MGGVDEALFFPLSFVFLDNDEEVPRWMDLVGAWVAFGGALVCLGW